MYQMKMKGNRKKGTGGCRRKKNMALGRLMEGERPMLKVQVWVVPTDEEIVIARDTMELVKK